MAVSESASGTQSATVTTEHTLSTQTTAGVYQLHVNLVNLANGDTVILRLKTKTLTGSTSRILMEQAFSHVQGEPNFASPAFMVAHEIVATLEQSDGTGRSFEWSLLTA